jgi:hypothetical protein
VPHPQLCAKQPASSRNVAKMCFRLIVHCENTDADKLFHPNEST